MIMRSSESPTVGVILVAPSSLLRSLVERILASTDDAVSAGTEGLSTENEPELAHIIAEPLSLETLEQLTHLIRKCGHLSPENVFETFPQNFVLYADSLDLTNPRDLTSLNHLCDRLGHCSGNHNSPGAGIGRRLAGAGRPRQRRRRQSLDEKGS